MCAASGLAGLPIHLTDVQTLIMFNEEWWSKLSPATREWLMSENGDAVPEAIAVEVVSAGGPVAAETEGEDAEPGLFFSDEIVDWVEEKANFEDPSGSP